MDQPTSQVTTALLTTGTGSLPVTAFRVLQEVSDLRGVVFSVKARRISRWQRLKAYGWWGTGQFISTALLNRLFNRRIDLSDLIRTGIDTIQWHKRQDETAVSAWLQQRQVQAVFVCSFQHILRPSFFDQFSACLNIHPSYLPEYRGPEPVLWGLLDDVTHFGVTLHKIDQGIDTGEIILQANVEKPKLPLAWLVENQLAQEIPAMLREVVQKIADGTLTGCPQQGGFYKPVATLENRR